MHNLKKNHFLIFQPKHMFLLQINRKQTEQSSTADKKKIILSECDNMIVSNNGFKTKTNISQASR